METDSNNLKIENKNKKAMILVVSDLHTNSRTAVINPKSKLEGNISVPYSPRQAKIYQKMNEGIDFLKKVADNLGVENKLVVCNGDGLDGVHHQSPEYITSDEDDQVTLAQDVLINFKRFSESFIFTKGTSVHTGKNSEREKLVAKEFGAIRNNDGERVWEKVQFDLNGTFFDIAHHTNRPGRTPDTFYNPFFKSLNAVVDDNPGKKKYVVIRSHIHIYSSMTTDNRKTFITTPSLQGATNYIYSFNPNTRGFQMGILGILINEDGSIKEYPCLFSIEEDHYAKKIF